MQLYVYFISEVILLLFWFCKIVGCGVRKLLLWLGLVVLTAGCASVAPSHSLSSFDGVVLEPWVSGAQAVTGVSFSHEMKSAPRHEIGFCAAQYVSNQQVAIRDESNSFYGSATGNYYRVERSRNIGGGETVAHASQDGKSVVLRGSTSYHVVFLTPIERVVQFTLAIHDRNGLMDYKFSNIEVAQLSTGVVRNDGFGKLGAYEGAKPEAALNALKNISDNIQSCLN